MRKDVHVYNEATGFVITSGSFNGKKPRDFEGKKWVERIKDGTFIPVMLVQDDSFNVRVIVNEALNQQESDEWVDRVVWKLAVPDGKLVITAGSELIEGEEMDEEYTKTLSIEPGTYQVEIYNQLPGVNGDFSLAEAGISEEEIPDYFKRTRPGNKMPEWMAQWLDLEEDEDEGEGEEKPDPRDTSWNAWDESEENQGPEEIGPSGIDFVLRLTPLKEEPSLPKLDENWLAIVQNPRVPEKCPLGLMSMEVAGIHDRTPYVQKDLIYRAPVAEKTRDLPIAPIEGGPVELAIEDAVLVYWFAWMCRDGVFVQARIDLNGRSFEPNWPNLKAGFAVERTPSGYVIDFEGNNSKWSNIRRLHRFGHLLKELPDGAVLEMDTCEVPEAYGSLADSFEDNLAGFHRYRGEVSGGRWRIVESFPQLPRGDLEDILELSRQVDRGEPIRMRDQTELDAVLKDVTTQDFALRDKPPVANGLSLSCADLMLTAFLGAWTLRARYSGRFDMISLGDDLEEWDNAMAKLQGAFAAPRSEETAYVGRSGKFFRADMSDFAAEDEESVAEHDAEMAALGLVVLGDLVSERIPDVMFRGYAHPSKPIWGAMNRNFLGDGNSDLVTRFPDGWSLSTSTSARSDKSDKQSYCQGEDNASLADMMELHLRRLEELIPKHGEPKPVSVDLAAFAQAVDEYLVKELALPVV